MRKFLENSKRFFVVGLLMIGLLLLEMGAAWAISYTITDLGTLPGGNDSSASGINDSGQVVGMANTGSGYEHAFLFSAGVMQDLGTLGGNYSYARGINNSGQVVGEADTGAGYGNEHAFLYSGGVVQDLGTFPGGNYSYARGINNSGQVVGMANAGSGYGQPFIYSGGVMQLGGGAGEANGINDFGQVVGETFFWDGYHAFLYSGGVVQDFLYSGGVVQDLGTLGGNYSYARGINNSGQVVGEANTGAGSYHAFLYSEGVMQDLGTLGGNDSYAYGINDSGQVVGRAETGDGYQRAFLYSEGVMQDLNNLLPAGSGWRLSEARDINNQGQIVGYGWINGQQRAFLMTPVSESFTLAITKGGTGIGTVTSNPAGIDCGVDCSEAYNSGTVVTITATPDSDSTFAGWSGDPDCSDGSVTMDADKNCTATFNLNTFTLTITKGDTGSGTVASSPAGIDCGSDCSEPYNSGTTVNLTPTPDSGSFFTGWSGDADCSDGQVTADADKTCTATFNIQTFTLSVSVSGSGTVNSSPAGINCPSDCTEDYTAATSVTLTATPVAGWSFSGWGGDCTGTGTCTIMANANVSVTATFTIQSYQFTNFTADVMIKQCHHPEDDKFKVKGGFTLNSGSDGINPLTENVSLQVGTFTTTIPAGSFTQGKKGVFKFKGVINGVNLKMLIRPIGGNSYKYKVSGKNANLTGTVNPVPVALIIGNDNGNTSDMAKIKPCHHKEKDEIDSDDTDD